MGSGVRWRFVNRANEDETVILYDQPSAVTLSTILKLQGGAQWVVIEERIPEAAPLEVTLEAPLAMHPEKEHIPEKPRGERRKLPRSPSEFRVILVSGSASFRTASLDVSLGGMLLKQKLPEGFLAKSCVAYISHDDLKENIELLCHVVGDAKDPRRIQFQNPGELSLKRLDEWIQTNEKPRAS